MFAAAAFGIGLASLTLGVGYIYPPAGLIVFGLVLTCCAVLYQRGELRARRRASR